MVLLCRTRELSDRLDALRPLLPGELVDLISSYSTEPPSTRSPRPGPTIADPDRERGVRVGTIDHGVLVRVARWARGQDESRLNHHHLSRDEYRLSNLVKLAPEVYAPRLKPRAKSPELVAILSSLQLAQDRKLYSRMTSLSAPTHRSLVSVVDDDDDIDKNIGEEWRQIKKELSAIVNVLVSVAAVFTSVYYVAFGYSPAIRLGLSLAGAVAIGAIESWLYWRVFTRIARERAQTGTDLAATAGGNGSDRGSQRGRRSRGAPPPPRLESKVLKFE